MFGSTGLLGMALLEQLLEHGKKVRIFVREPVDDGRVEQVIGDICNENDVRKAVKGVDTVFQAVSIIDLNPNYQQFVYDVNVKGNHYVIDACAEFGVEKLIYTSSIDVVFDGNHLLNEDESLPYPSKHLDHYSISKTMAEKEVIAANGRPNGKQGLLTCSLRAAGIYGPGDRIRIPTIIQALRDGKYIRLGDGSTVFSHVYSENCAHAHIKAAEYLQPDSPVSGECYFITDFQANNFFVHVEEICRGLGYDIPNISLPCWLLKIIGWISEEWAKLRKAKKAPLLTNYVVASPCHDFSFTHDKATRDFDYDPIVSKDEGIKRTVAWFKKEGWGRD